MSSRAHRRKIRFTNDKKLSSMERTQSMAKPMDRSQEPVALLAQGSDPEKVVPNGGLKPLDAVDELTSEDPAPRGSVMPDSSTESETADPASDPLSFKPFPVECLPETVRRFVVEAARAMGCDESFLALPALTVIAGMIGNSARIRLKNTWFEPAILWTAIVAESGAGKSPPLAAVTAHMHALNKKEIEDYERKKNLYDWRLRDHAEQKQAIGVELTSPPTKPVFRQWMVGDISFDELTVRLSRQWRGMR